MKRATKEKDLVEEARTLAENSVRKMSQRKSACTNEGPQVDCEDVKPGAGVDSSKLDFCMKQTDSDIVKSNIIKAFKVGNLRTGCALLSLATNPMLRAIHDCMCGPTTGGAANDSQGENVGAVADQLQNSKNDEAASKQGNVKTLTDSSTKRFLRLRATRAQLLRSANLHN